MDLTLAGSKLRKKLGSQLRESVSAPVSAFAVQQMQRLGWTEGTGLGKKRDGRVTHIQVVQRKDSAGLGSEKMLTETALPEEWWKDSLGDTLAKLSAAGDSSGKKKRSKKTFTDEELFEATGGARFGMRSGKTRNLAKWRRTESTVSSSTSATNSSTNLAQRTDSNKTIIENCIKGSSCGRSDRKESNQHKREEAPKEKSFTSSKESRERSCKTEEERKERKRLKKEKKKQTKIEKDSSQC